MTVINDRRFGFVGDLAEKAPVDCATTGNIALAGLQICDGFQTFEQNGTDPLCRILVWQQTNPVENGIYNPSTGIWTRAVDWNGQKDFVKGTRVNVTSGDTYGGANFELVSENPVIIGTSAITFNELPLGGEGGRLSFPYIQSPFDVTSSITGSDASLSRVIAAFTVYLWNGRIISIPATPITFPANKWIQVWIESGGTLFQDVQPADNQFVDYTGQKTPFLYVVTSGSSIDSIRLRINSAFVEKKGAGLPYTDTDFDTEFMDITLGANAGIPRTGQINGNQSDYFILKYWKAFARFRLETAKSVVERFFNTLFCVPWVSNGIWSFGAKTIGADAGGGTYCGHVYSVTGFVNNLGVALTPVAASTLYYSRTTAGVNTSVIVGTGNYETRLTYRVYGFTTDVPYKPNNEVSSGQVYAIDDIIQMAGYNYKCTAGGVAGRFTPVFGGQTVSVAGTDDLADDPDLATLVFERGTRTSGTTGTTLPTWGDTFVTSGTVIFILLGATVGRSAVTVPAGFASGADTVIDYNPNDLVYGGVVWTKQSIFNPNTHAAQTTIEPTHKWFMILTGPASGSPPLPVGLQFPDAHDSSAAAAAIACHAIAEQMQGDFPSWFQKKTRIPKSDTDFYTLEELVYQAYYYSIAVNFTGALTNVFQNNKLPGGATAEYPDGVYAQQFLEDNLETWQGIKALSNIYENYCFGTTIASPGIAALRAALLGNVSYVAAGIIGTFRKQITDLPGQYFYVYAASEPAPASTDFATMAWYPHWQSQVMLLVSDFTISGDEKRIIAKRLDTYMKAWWARTDITNYPSIAFAMEFADVCTMSEILPDALAAVRGAYISGRAGTLQFGDAVALLWFARRGLQKTINIISTQVRDGKYFGMRGDGVTNDRQAFILGMNQTAENGERLYLSRPDNFYYIQGFNCQTPSNLTLEFDTGAWIKPKCIDNFLGGNAGGVRKHISNIHIINPHIDGILHDFYAVQVNATAWAGGYGSDGVFYFSRNIRIDGGLIKNYIANFDISGPGAKAAGFEEGVFDVLVDGLVAENVTYPFFASPTYRDPTHKVTRGIVFQNVIARNCAALFFVIGDDVRLGEYPNLDPYINSIIMQGKGWNIGHFTEGRRGSSIPSMKDGCIIMAATSNVFIDAQIFNDFTYPSVARPAGGTKFPSSYPAFSTNLVGAAFPAGSPIGSVIVGSPGSNNVIKVYYNGDCDDIIRLQNANVNGNYNAFSEIRPRGCTGMDIDIKHIGTAKTVLRTGQSSLKEITCTAATSSSITLPATWSDISGDNDFVLSNRDNEYTGYRLSVVAGTGAGQMFGDVGFTVISSFDATTRIATVSPAFTVTPSSVDSRFNCGSSRDGVGTDDFTEYHLTGVIDDSGQDMSADLSGMTGSNAHDDVVGLPGSLSFGYLPKTGTAEPIYPLTVGTLTGITAAVVFPSNDTPVGMTLYIVSGVGAGQSKVIFDYTASVRKLYFASVWTVVPNALSYFEIRDGATVVYSGQCSRFGSDVCYVTLPAGASDVDNKYVGETLILTGSAVYMNTAQVMTLPPAPPADNTHQVGAILDPQRFKIVLYDASTRRAYVSINGVDAFKVPPASGSAFKITNVNLNQLSGIIKVTTDVLSENKIVHQSIDTNWSSVKMEVTRCPTNIRAQVGGVGTIIEGSVTDIRDNRNTFPTLLWPRLSAGGVQTNTFSLADNAATSITPKYRRGFLKMRYYNLTSGNIQSTLTFQYNVTAGTIDLLDVSANTVTNDDDTFGGGAGNTTGVDGKFNVSAKILDGKLYFKNRTGGSAVSVIAETGAVN